MWLTLKKVMLLTVILSVYGCSAPLTVNSMVPDMPAHINKNNFSISVERVDGGAENYLERYKSTFNEDMHGEVLQKALILTLTKSTLFKSVTTDLNEKYALKANIIFQDTDFNRVGGGSLTYTLIASYLIKDRITNRVIYKNQFTSACLKRFSDAAGGGARFKLALECSVKSNLSKLVADLNRKTLT